MINVTNLPEAALTVIKNVCIDLTPTQIKNYNITIAEIY